MKRIFLALVFGFFTTSAQAAVLDISVGFAGGDLGLVTFDVRLDADFSGDIAPTTTGLTINSLSFVPDGGLGYLYNAPSDTLFFFGLANGLTIFGNTSDFFVRIGSIGTTPSILDVSDSSALTPNSIGSPSPITLTVTTVSTVPLPASGLLLLGSVAGAAALKRRKKRTA